MKHFDPSLENLLHAAAQHRPAVEPEPPFGFATRVAAAWLAGAGMAGQIGQERAAAMQAVWFRRAFFCALAVMVFSVGWTFRADNAAPGDDLGISAYDATPDLP
jgi:hypothetical protein